VPLSGVVNPDTTLGGTAPLKFGKAKTSRIRRDVEELSSLTANISGTDWDIDQRLTALSSRITLELNKQNWWIWSTNRKVIGAHVDPPQGATARSVYANFESLTVNISGMDTDIDKRWTAIPSALNKRNLVKFSPLTTMVSARMLTHSKSTTRILRMLTYLSSGHVTLLRGEFQPAKLSRVGLTAPGVLTLGSARYF